MLQAIIMILNVLDELSIGQRKREIDVYEYALLLWSYLDSHVYS